MGAAVSAYRLPFGTELDRLFWVTKPTLFSSSPANLETHPACTLLCCTLLQVYQSTVLSELGGRVSLYRAPEPCTMQYKQGTFSNFYPRGRYRSAKWEEGRGLTLPERA